MVKTRSHSRFWVVALAGLAATAGGANWFFHFHPLNRNSAVGDTPPVAPIDEDTRAYCFGHVDVEYGVRSLYPLQPGRIAEVLVHEGDAVKKGQPLLRLDTKQAQLLVREAEADVAAAKAQLAEVRKLPAQQQSKRRQQESAIEATKKRLSAARHALERKQNLVKIQQLNQQDAEAAADLVNEAEAALRAEQEKLRELDLHDPQIAIKRAEEDVAAKEARLERARQALDECTLKAPEAGAVLRILNGPGDVLGTTPPHPAMVFTPAGDRFVRAEVTQEFADLAQVGQPAVIQDDTRATKTWRGTVTHVSDWYTQRRSILLEPQQVNDVRTLECIVRIEPGQPPLRIGQRVRVILGGK